MNICEIYISAIFINQRISIAYYIMPFKINHGITLCNVYIFKDLQHPLITHCEIFAKAAFKGNQETCMEFCC